jgi:hypothetical protein
MRPVERSQIRHFPVPPGAPPAAIVTETCQPIARQVDAPEILAKYCPRIYYAA